MKTVTLANPLLEGKVTEFTFREPRLADYMVFGDPRAPIINGDRLYMRAIPETVKLYADRLLTNGDPAVMEFASLKDALAIQAVILDFFADAESAGTEKKKTSSSSSDAGSPS